MQLLELIIAAQVASACTSLQSSHMVGARQLTIPLDDSSPWTSSIDIQHGSEILERCWTRNVRHGMCPGDRTWGCCSSPLSAQPGCRAGAAQPACGWAEPDATCCAPCCVQRCWHASTCCCCLAQPARWLLRVGGQWHTTGAVLL